MEYLKKRLGEFLTVFLIILLVSTGCSNSGNNTNNSNSTNNSSNNSDEVNPALTSTEAALMAYTEAIKWNKDAIIWYISPVRIDKDWEENDRALWWTVVFANPENDSEIQIYIHDGKINGVQDVGNKRDTSIKAGYPKDKLLTTMKDAAKTAIANGAFKGLMPDMVYYDTESLSFPDRPVWSIVYRPKTPDGSEEIHLYFIDGLTSAFIQVAYKDKDGNLIKASDVKATAQSALSSGQSQNNDPKVGSSVIYAFFDKINKNNIDEAILLMDKSMTGNETNRNMWINNFKSLNKVEITGMKEHLKNEWKSDKEIYEVTLKVDAGNNAENYSWSDGENIRWVTVVMSGGKWIISEISTGG